MLTISPEVAPRPDRHHVARAIMSSSAELPADLARSAAPLARSAEPGFVARVLLSIIRLYQKTLSKLLVSTVGPVCRFEPSCSRYSAACIQAHGAWRGSLLSARRLCKCHPFHAGGFDPPPPAR